MPEMFQFINTVTNEPQLLNKIDEEMCEDCKIECDPNRFCNLYQLCTTIGCSPKVQNEKGDVDLEKLTKLITTENEFSMSPNEIEILKKYLCGKYRFNAWFQRY